MSLSPDHNPEVVSNREAVTQIYDAMAATYEDDQWEPFYEAQYRAYEETLAELPARLHGKVLDLGCGTGIHTAMVARHASHVVGLDISQGLLTKARARCDSSIGLLRADARSLPHATGYFDAVVSLGEPLSHITEHEAAFAECTRVLKRGGMFLFSVLNKWNVRLLRHPAELARALAQRERHHDRLWISADDHGKRMELSLRAFPRTEIDELGRRYGYRIDDARALHISSTLVPFRLQERRDSPWAWAYRRLGKLDRRLGRARPFVELGYTCIYTATRT